jgi:PIN domain
MHLLQEFDTERANDGLILDCCKYFHEVRKQRTFLCSADKNLCFEAESECKHTLALRNFS